VNDLSTLDHKMVLVRRSKGVLLDKIMKAKVEAEAEALRKERQFLKEKQAAELLEQERLRLERSGQDDGYINVISREKRRQIMTVDPRVLVQRYGKSTFLVHNQF
jgi:hypothetical protein